MFNQIAAGVALAGVAATGVSFVAADSVSNDPTRVKLSDYASTSGDATAGLVAAAKALQTKSGWKGGTIEVDGRYIINNTIQLDQLEGTAEGTNIRKYWQAVRVVGNGVGASQLIKENDGRMFQTSRMDVCWPSAAACDRRSGVSLSNLGFENLGITIRGAAYAWELKSGSLTNSAWLSTSVEVTGRGGIMYVGPSSSSPNGAEFHSNSFRDQMYHVAKDSPVIPMRFASAHHFVNGNTFDRVWAHHRANNLVPFWEMRPKSGVYTNNSWRAITGEQNLAGLIHVYGQSGGSMTAIAEWDGVAPGYNADVIRIGSSSTAHSSGVTLSGSGIIVHSNSVPPVGTPRTVSVSANNTADLIGSSIVTIPVK